MARKRQTTAKADGLEHLLGAVLDGQIPVGQDPDATPTFAGVSDDRQVAALQAISRIADFNRGLQRASGSRIAVGSLPTPASDSSLPASSLSSLFSWGHLEVLELVGRGSFGEVYRAIDTRLQREVALKLRRVEAFDPGGDQQFLTEARGLARVRHPNVIGVYGADTHGDKLGFWTEFVHGKTLSKHLNEKGPLDEKEILLIGLDLCRALKAVHATGLVHGDVKPSNAMIEPGGRVVLTDFGCARPPSDEKPGRGISGSPLFMAPEVLAGAPPHPAADLYSLGALLHQLATGRPPFTARSVPELREHQANQRRPPLRELRPELGGAFTTVVERALSIDPEERYASAAEMESGLAEAVRSHDVDQHSLPAELDPLIGREKETAELERRFAGGSRLITLLGAAGMGKTRLAVHHGWEAVRAWPGRVWFCDLSEARNREGILASVASSLAVPLGKGDPVEQLGRAIGARGRCLVILDNFEQVVEHAEATVGRWLDRAPEARFLVTSRERLHVRGETVHVIDELTIESGAALFNERAHRRQAGYDLEGPASESVRELVKLVDGIPLAIELAAARITVMTPEEMVTRMRDRFRVLGGRRTASGRGREGRQSRHATLAAAIDGSWELLAPWEKAAFAQCAVFQGGFILEAAEKVLDLSAWPDAPWVMDVVQNLVDKSLLRVGMSGASGSGSERAGQIRMAMYPSLQDYARARLGEMGADVETGAEIAHGRCFARYGSDEAILSLDQPGGIERSRHLVSELENVMAAGWRAVRRGDGEIAAAAVRAAGAVTALRASHGRDIELAKATLSMELTPQDRTAVLLCLSRGERVTGAIESAQARAQEALVLSRKSGNRHAEGVALGALGTVLQQQGRMEEGFEHDLAALGIHREVGDRLHESMALDGLAVNLLLRGRIAEARDYFESALRTAREIGSRTQEGTILGNLAIVSAEQGRPDEARSLYESALAIHREAGDPYGECNDLNNIANLLSDQGFLAEARTHYETSLAIAREIGVHALEGLIRGNLGTIDAEEGRTAEAQAHFQAALAIAQEMSNRRSEGYAHGYLGSLAREMGAKVDAHTHFTVALAIAREIGNRRLEGITLGSLGTVLGDEERWTEARAAFASGEAALREVGEQGALGILLCDRAEMEQRALDNAAASSLLSEAERLADTIAATPASQLRRKLAKLRARP